MPPRAKQGSVPSPRKDVFNDRGPAVFFHGREGPRDKFREVLDIAAESPRLGTAMIVQGPPGVGKTALLHQLEEDAKELGWIVFNISPEAFETPAEFSQAIGKAFVEARKETLKAGAKIVEMNLSKSIAGSQSVAGALRDTMGEGAKIVLVVDEAQQWAETSSQAAAVTIRTALNDIVNGRTGRRVVLVAGGLSHTGPALRARGVSRLRSGCEVSLVRVKDKTAAAILRDWLSAVACADEHLEAWTTALLPVADNWPQHLICCAAAAASHFASADSTPSAASIQSVTDGVRRAKEAFYDQRARGIPGTIPAALGMLVGAWGPQKSYLSRTIMAVLSIDKDAPDTMTPRQYYDALIKQGVIAEVRAGKLRIPIPSMERYLMAQAISLAVDAPVIAQEYWREVCAIAFATVGRIAPDLQKQIEPILASNRGLQTGMADNEDGLER
ncbi:MAG: ATP-binding protein [Bacteroidota bacterium]|nr:ATP-binding protein [Bacteroidota bacterium]